MLFFSGPNDTFRVFEGQGQEPLFYAVFLAFFYKVKTAKRLFAFKQKGKEEGIGILTIGFKKSSPTKS